MATDAERRAERERRRREAEERKKREELAKQPGPDQVTVVGGDPNFQLGGGTFSILGIVENQALGGAQVISDQVQFKNANDQRQFGGVVNQVVGGQPDQQNNQQAGQQPAGPNGQPNNQQAGAAGAQPGQEKPAAEGDEPPDLLKLGAGLADEDDVEVEVNIDAKGGKSRHRDFVNFLARDEVPDSIFGIPIVQDESQYTEKDLEFFRRNPKAAGFYDLGDEEMSTPAADMKGGVASAWGALKRRAGETGEVLDAGIAWMERQAKQTADMDVPLLSAAARMLQPAYVGARAAIANATSGGGRYYRPEARDERYFSKAALAEIARNVGARRVEMSGRPGAWEASQSVGGFSVRDGKVTDVFDVNKSYDVVPDAMTSFVGGIFGRDSDPDAGKVRTEIPLKALRQDVKGGKAIEAPTLSDDRPMHIFRDDSGKVTGYGTTRSMVHEQDGRYYVIPTILVDGRGGTRVADDGEAVGHFRKTGEHWGGYADRLSAEDAAEAVHERHQRLYGKKWNDYIQDHWNEMSDEIKNDPGVADARHARIRGLYPGSLNNPGNVEKRKERRQGEVDSPHERWAKFATPQDGLREMADAIRQIAAVKLAEKGRDFTIRNFAEVYAPRVNKRGEKENDTDKYIRDLSADTGFDADEELARWDEGDMARFLRSVVKFESGAKHSAWFTDEEYAAAAAKLQEGAFE